MTRLFLVRHSDNPLHPVDNDMTTLAKAVRNDDWRPVATEATGFIFKSSTGSFCTIRTGKWILFTCNGVETRYEWADPVGRQLAQRVVG